MPAKLSVKHWIKVTIGAAQHPVILGDTIWYYPGSDVSQTPLVGQVTLISEDNMVDVVIISDVAGVGKRVHKGVCLYGDDRLANPNIRNKGCWMPRWLPEQVMATPQHQNEG